MEQTPKEEAQDLIDDVVDEKRSQIIEKHEKLINKITEQTPNFREMNIIFSETRRRLENDE